MKLKKLRSAEITTIYQERLVHDFIKDELKKLPVILKAVDDGIYECLGLFDDSEIIGYTFLVKQGMSFLVDYLAVCPKYRNKGLGSEIIGLLREYMSGAGLIILEVEDPTYTKERDLKELQTRRIGFYERNGCIDTGLSKKRLKLRRNLSLFFLFLARICSSIVYHAYFLGNPQYKQCCHNSNCCFKTEKAYYYCK